jgi:hypothetical protein
MSNLWYENHRRLSRGDRGPDVEKLQRALNAAGANPAVKPNGIFDAGTEAEVRAFQKRVDLIDDGRVGPVTHAVLFESNFKYAPVRPPIVRQGSAPLCWAAALESVLQGPWPLRKQLRVNELRKQFARFLTQQGAISERGIQQAGKELKFRDITPKLEDRSRLHAEVLLKLLASRRPLLLVDDSTGSIAHTRVIYGVEIKEGIISVKVMDPLRGYDDVSLDMIQPSMITLSILAADEVRL